MRFRVLIITALIATAMVAVASSCSNRSDKEEDNSDVLLAVGDSVLTRSKVEQMIPRGLTEADSAALFDAIVENWLEKYMLAEVAQFNVPDLDRIETMVQDYRRQLLANEYRRIMAHEKSGDIPLDSVKAYYESHKEDFVLEEPIVRGIYIKIPANAEQIGKIRKWMSSATASAIDELEKYGLRGAMQYDYFMDRWVAWSEIADQIPYRFSNPDLLVSQTKNFETTADGSTYMLHIAEAMTAGETMPFEVAQETARDRLSELNMRDFDRHLLSSIYAEGVKKNTIKPGSYVPLKYRKK